MEDVILVEKEKQRGGERKDSIDIAPTINGALGRGFTFLCFTDQRNDALQGTVFFSLGD
jgi:hypothetical protein